MGGPKGISANPIQIFDTIAGRLLSATGFYSHVGVRRPASTAQTASSTLVNRQGQPPVIRYRGTSQAYNGRHRAPPGQRCWLRLSAPTKRRRALVAPGGGSGFGGNPANLTDEPEATLANRKRIEDHRVEPLPQEALCDCAAGSGVGGSDRCECSDYGNVRQFPGHQPGFVGTDGGGQRGRNGLRGHFD
jgi:hypothetical protein